MSRRMVDRPVKGWKGTMHFQIRFEENTSFHIVAMDDNPEAWG